MTETVSIENVHGVTIIEHPRSAATIDLDLGHAFMLLVNLGRTSGAVVKGAKFKNEVFRFKRIAEVEFIDCVFEDCSFDSSLFLKCIFKSCVFENVRRLDTTSVWMWVECKINKTKFNITSKHNVFTKCDIYNVDIDVRSKCENMEFNECKIRRTNIRTKALKQFILLHSEVYNDSSIEIYEGDMLKISHSTIDHNTKIYTSNSDMIINKCSMINGAKINNMVGTLTIDDSVLVNNVLDNIDYNRLIISNSRVVDNEINGYGVKKYIGMFVSAELGKKSKHLGINNEGELVTLNSKELVHG